MKPQLPPIWAFLVAAGIFSLSAPTTLPAADGPAGGYDPRLIVPIPILRRHVCAADYSVPMKRGVAIMSPIESPDHDCSEVGGKPICVPYYPDYARPGKQGPRLSIPDNGAGYCCPGSPVDSGVKVPAEQPAAVEPSGSYGYYSGGNQNEAMLLHLGGNSTADPAARPAGGPSDLIDLIHSGQ